MNSNPLILILATAALVIPCSSRGDLTVETSSQPASWTFKQDGKPVLVYSFSPQAFKPYIKALYTTSGRNVLRDSPYDHLHHHALMYGIKANGVNFWEEVPGCGIQRVIQTSEPKLLPGSGGNQAEIRQLLHWVTPEDAFLPPTNSPALLIEQRTITLTIDPQTHEIAVHWRSQFEVGAKTNIVTLTGANYHGLGMRFSQELDSLASHFSGDGSPDLSNNKQDVSAHKWTAVSFNDSASPVTMALFGHSANARGNANFFSMKTPFAYLSATQGLEKEPLVYRRGDHFELNYLVCLYPEVKSSQSLQKRYQQWESSERIP
jgi:hypothetical protein